MIGNRCDRRIEAADPPASNASSQTRADAATSIIGRVDVRMAIVIGSDNVSTLRNDVPAIETAVMAGGGTVVDLDDANALIWLSLDGQRLKETLASHHEIEWVQLPWAGVETFAREGVFEEMTSFTSAKGAFGGEVGEHAFFLILAVLRNAVRMARLRHWRYIPPVAGGIADKRVTVVGGGGIAQRLVDLLHAGQAATTVVRRSRTALPGADRTVTVDRLHDLLPETDVLALCLPLTPQTQGMIGAAEIARMPKGSVVVNVGRGKLIDTDALVGALASGHLLGAGLDVTDPEPLHDRHPLWDFDNVLITSHSADSDAFCDAQLLKRIEANVRRFGRGNPLLGLVDKQAGY